MIRFFCFIQTIKQCLLNCQVSEQVLQGSTWRTSVYWGVSDRLLKCLTFRGAARQQTSIIYVTKTDTAHPSGLLTSILVAMGGMLLCHMEYGPCRLLWIPNILLLQILTKLKTVNWVMNAQFTPVWIPFTYNYSARLCFTFQNFISTLFSFSFSLSCWQRKTSSLKVMASGKV